MKEMKLFVGEGGGLVHACACLGRQGSDPYCPCEMNRRGLQRSLKESVETSESINEAFKQIFHNQEIVPLLDLLEKIKHQIRTDPDTFFDVYDGAINAMLDDIRSDDGFGTEGQLDPRN